MRSSPGPRRFAAHCATTLAAVLAFCAPPAAATFSCANLASLALPDTSIKTAVEVPAGSFTPPGSTTPLTGLPAFCRVVGVIAPAINFEVWLPLSGWNNRFQGVGNGGLAGSISYGALATALREGYATASTDTGHLSSDTTWLTNAQQLIDYGYRAIHEITVKSKAIVESFYTQPARYSYFNGCSTGGGQGLMQAQRYPADYDGILAGAPNWDQISLRAGGHVWAWVASHLTSASGLTATQFNLLNKAALAKCDAIDGLADGIIDDPRRCKFDPGTLACASGQDPTTCLTAPQLAAVRKIYAGGTSPTTGARIWPGYLPGSELGWNQTTGALPFGAATTFFRFAVFKNPTYDFLNFDFDRDTALARQGFASILVADSPNLRRFKRRGGKLLLYHGFADPLITTTATLDYYGKLLDFFEDRREHHSETMDEVREFARLFLIPGMGHCSGGPGTDTFDGMGALVDWVENGRAPRRILASHLTNGVVDKTRPLCVYPSTAVYAGSGDPNRAENFVCRTPRGGHRHHRHHRD